VARAKMAAVEAGASREETARPAPIDPGVAALLDHIAEDLAREYVRLMENAAHEGDAGASASRDRREA